MSTHKIINKNSKLQFTGKDKTYTVPQALNLFDSLGGAAEGFSIIATHNELFKQGKKIDAYLQFKSESKLRWSLAKYCKSQKVQTYGLKVNNEKIDALIEKYSN